MEAIWFWMAKDFAPWVEFLTIGGALVLYCVGMAVRDTLMEKLRRKKED